METDDDPKSASYPSVKKSLMKRYCKSPFVQFARYDPNCRLDPYMVANYLYGAHIS